MPILVIDCIMYQGREHTAAGKCGMYYSLNYLFQYSFCMPHCGMGMRLCVAPIKLFIVHVDMNVVSMGQLHHNYTFVCPIDLAWIP